MKSGVELIAEERAKQIAKYNHTGYTDSCYENKELLQGAITYIQLAMSKGEYGHDRWPWHPDSLKDEGYIENLKKAGAFIAAELDRVQLN